MSKRESTSEQPVLQVVGFHVDKPIEGTSPAEPEDDADEVVSESSVPYLPPSKGVRVHHIQSTFFKSLIWSFRL
jgi:hypothetical protein